MASDPQPSHTHRSFVLSCHRHHAPLRVVRTFRDLIELLLTVQLSSFQDTFGLFCCFLALSAFITNIFLTAFLV